MIRDFRSLNLFDKRFLEMATLRPPFRVRYDMGSEACFIYVLKGTFRGISQTNLLTLGKQDAMLMKCGLYSGEVVPDEQDEGVQLLAFHFDAEMLRRVYGNKLPVFLKAKPDAEAPEGMSALKGDRALANFVNGVAQYFEDSSLASEELLGLKLRELLELLSKTRGTPSMRRLLASLFLPREYAFQEVIEAHCYTSVDVEELCHLTNLSPSTFKRRFQELYGDSPGSYLRTRRLQRAAELLAISTENVSIIAFDCGFDSAAHFATSFKAEFGKSPSEYRMDQLQKTLA